MIEQIRTSSVNIQNTQNTKHKNQPQFKGGIADGVLSAIQLCEQNPMVNVTVLDLATAIVPRTVVESETNPYAGFEAFRRESSGLIVNCLIPSLFVLGIAKATQGYFMGKGSKMANCWANEDAIKLIANYWEGAPDAKVALQDGTVYEGQKAKVYNTIKKIFEETKGVDGKDVKAFNVKEFEDSIKTLTEKSFVQSYGKGDKDAIKQAYKAIASKTHMTENLKIGQNAEYFSQNLKALTEDMPRILRELVNGKAGSTESFINKSVKLLNTKSLGGLAIILPLAISMQPINRWITAKSSGKKGAPIYKDFADTKSKELTPKEKSELFKQKLISVASMVGVAFLSMGGKLPGMKVLQFKGLFPTMDQARIISTATFASRMMASEDKNDLREATVRDIATFSSFYFLGDYVAKGIATLIQKKNGVQLINVLKERSKNANTLEKIWHWTKHTALKSSDEVVGETAKKMRSVCQLGNIAFSLIALGLVIPKMYRGQTEKHHNAESNKISK